MIKRFNHKKIVASLKKREITILIGARQVGKTTMLKKIQQDLIKDNKRVLYLNMDVERDAAFFESQQRLLSKIRLEFGDNVGYVFVDEIQQKEDAGRFLKGLYDMDLPYKFVVTGSGSLELKEMVGEALTGRKHTLLMNAVSFEEFVDYRTNYKYSDRLSLFFETDTTGTALYLGEYLNFGGYPKVVSTPAIQERIDIMNEIFSSYVMKDISILLGVRSSDKFVKMISLLAVQCGEILNYSQLANDVGVSTETIKNYLWYAQQTFMIRLAKPFFTNRKKELTKSPVVYFNDVGMLNFARGRYDAGSNQGFVFQNFVFNILYEKYASVFTPVNHWRTKDKAEVDFVIHKEGKTIPVEVKYSHLKNDNLSRSFRSFLSDYQPEEACIVNLSLDTVKFIDNTKVMFIPYWKLFDL